MNPSMMLATRQVRRAPTRVLAVFLAALLSAMAIMGTGSFIGTMTQSTRIQVAAPLSETDVIVKSFTDEVTAEKIREIDVVEAAEPVLQSDASATFGDKQFDLPVESAYESEGLRWFDVTEGRLPTAKDELALSTDSVAEFDLKVGDRVMVATTYGEPASPVELVGVVDLPGDIESVPRLFLHPDSYGEGAFIFAVDAKPSVSTDTAMEEITSGLGQMNAEASDGRAYVNEMLDQVTRGANVLATMFLIFAAIATLAATMVIRNTFQVLLAQRLRETGLLRLVGATGAQVQRTVLAEALIVGLSGAVAGVLAGFGLGYGVASIAQLGFGGPAFPIEWALGATLVTVLVTVYAALAPAASMRRLAPIAALSASATTERSSQRSSTVGWVVGSVITLIGAAILALSAVQHNLLIALGGGVIAAIGLVILVPLLVRIITPPVSRMLAGMGAVPKLAGENLVRTARRSGTVVLAIAFGGSLVIAMLTAVGSVRDTEIARLDAKYPVDAVVASLEGAPLSDQHIERVRALEHTETAVPVRGLDIAAPQDAPFEFDRVVELPSDMADRATAPLESDVLLADPNWVGDNGAVPDGTTITISTESGESLELRVFGDPIAYSAQVNAHQGMAPLVAPSATFERFGGEPFTAQVWVDVQERESAAMVEDLGELTKNDPSLTFGGSVQERAMFEQITTFVIAFVLAMLALTIIISAVGLASVVALSVTERQREIALLRSLGMHRSGVRTMVITEAVTLALIGAALSIIIGVPLGMVAVMAAVAGPSNNLVLSFPWLGVAALIATATVLGVAAGIGPAIRAARIAPAQALAHGG